MAYGLKVWAADGVTVKVDTSLQAARLVASGSTTLDGSGQKTITVGTQAGKLFCFINRAGGSSLNFPSVSTNATQILIGYTVQGFAGETIYYWAFRGRS